MRSSDKGSPGTPLLVLVLLAVVVVAALYMRSWQHDYDIVHPDDPKQILSAHEFIQGNYIQILSRRGRDNAGYPYFAMHLLEWAYRGYEQVLKHVAPDTPTPLEALDDLTFRIYLRRFGLLLNCVYELIVLCLAFAIGRRLFDPWVGLAAAGVLAVSSLRIQVSHIIGADLPSSLFMFGVFYFCARLRDGERLRDWLGAGVCAGLAAATKYNGLLTLLAPGLVFIELRLRDEQGWRSALAPRRLAGPLAVFAAFAAAFVLATPTLILAPKAAVVALKEMLGVFERFRIPDEYAGQRTAFAVSLWYSHLNNLLRFFEPLPGWLTLVSLGVFLTRLRFRESFIWLYPLALIPVAGFGHPNSVPYHYLCVLSPLAWVIGFAFVAAIRALGRPWLRVAAVGLLGGWALLAAVSDTSVFTLPTADGLAKGWFADCAVPGRFRLGSRHDGRKQIYPRLFGIDFENFSAAARAERAQEAEGMKTVVANFELERRNPSLNHIRNRPKRIRWRDGVERDVELFPPPRRVAGGRRELLFPGNLILSRSPALMALTPGKAVVRRIRQEPGAAPWLLYAHYPARSTGRDKARLRLQRRGRWRTLWVEKGGDYLVDLDLRHTDLLFNGLFATVRLRSDEPVLVWLVSPQERGWFLLAMERWRDLETWEAGRSGWKSEARLAVARRHLGGAGVPAVGAAVIEAALPGFRTGDPAELFRVWTGGVDLGLYDDPRPQVALERFVVKVAGDELPPPDLPPGGRVSGPLEQLVPGFYRVTWEVSGSGGAGELEYRVTADAGARQVAALTLPLPEGRQAVSLPLRITASSPGWDLEFPVVNRGGAPVRLEGVRVENEPELQLRWWLEELKRALGDRNPS
jgi:hypothetical protein